MTKGTLALATLLCVGLASAQAQEQPEVFPQLGNSHGINALAFSPDGAVLASGGGDSRALLWELANARELRTLSGHIGALAMTYSPDGHVLALALSIGRSSYMIHPTAEYSQRSMVMLPGY